MDVRQIIRFAQSLDQTGESIDTLYEHLLAQFELKRPEERDFQRKGILISFDGHSGAGKDTQMALLSKHMREVGLFDGRNIIECIQKRNDPFRQVPKYLWSHPDIQRQTDCSLLLLTAGRRYFVHHILLPLLEDSRTIIVLNRSYLSHIAYHASSVDALPALISLSDFDPDPDLAFILECDVNTAYSRVIDRSPQKGGVIYKNEMPDYIKRVKRNFRKLATYINGLTFIDASDKPELIAREVSKKVDAYFQQ